MKLSDFNPDIDPSTIEDCEVVGVADGMIVHFNKDDGTIYNEGLTLQEWLDADPEAWRMTEPEAARVGITDYAAYEERIKELRPAICGM